MPIFYTCTVKTTQTTMNGINTELTIRRYKFINRFLRLKNEIKKKTVYRFGKFNSKRDGNESY